MNLRDIGRQPLKWLMIVSICFLFFHSFPSFASAVSKSLNGPKSGKSSDTGEYIVKFHEGAMRKAAMQLAGNNEATRSQGSDRPMLIRLKPDAEQDMLERLAADPAVEYIEPNIRLHATGKIADPYYPKQWGLDKIGAPKAWEQGISTSKVVVAVIDTGVDYTHPDLAGRVNTVDDFDYVNDDDDAQDDDGHGTHVAGIIAAQLDSQGIAGVAGEADVAILPLKALDAEGEGDLYDVAMAIMDAADLGADVINLSLSGTWDRDVYGEPKLMTEAVRYAMDKGALVVAAAGNEAKDAKNELPASIEGVVTVSAVDRSLRLAGFSNYGSAVELAAPGVEILSTYPDGRYAYGSGTSQATPFVSGTAALIKAQEPELDAEELAESLFDSATDLGKRGRDVQYGYGLVNAYRALKADGNAKQNTVHSIVSSPNKLSLKPGDTSQLTITAVYEDRTKQKVTSKVEWTSSNEKVASVKNGLVTAHAFGTATIRASYQGKTVSVPVEIAVSRLKASRTTLTMKPGGEAALAITAVYGDKSIDTVPADQIAWKSYDEEVATVDNGVVTAKNVGSTYVIATYGGKSVKIRVEVSITRLVASPASMRLKPGDSAPVELVAVYGEEREEVTPSAAWKTSNARVAVYEDGSIVSTGFGTATITASYHGKSAKISVDTRLKKLEADSTRQTLKVQETFRPVIKATYSDNTTDIPTDGIEWASTDDEVAAVDENGNITAVGVGRATISAKYGGEVVKISITVTK